MRVARVTARCLRVTVERRSVSLQPIRRSPRRVMCSTRQYRIIGIGTGFPARGEPDRTLAARWLVLAVPGGRHRRGLAGLPLRMVAVGVVARR